VIGRLARSDIDQTAKLKASIHTKSSPKREPTWTYVKAKYWIGDWTSAFNCMLTSCAGVMHNLRRWPKRDRHIGEIRHRPNSKTQSEHTSKIIANATWTCVKPKCWIWDCTSAFHVHMNTAHASSFSITLCFKISLLFVSSLKEVNAYLGPRERFKLKVV
jgi:hypothetical protein